MHIKPIYSVKVPLESGISELYKSTNLSDAFMVRLNNNITNKPEDLARFLFSQQPSWVSALMMLREIFVRIFGLKTSAIKLLRQTKLEYATRIHYFNIYSSSQREIILGEDDKHLDFRLSVLYIRADETSDNVPQLILSTVVSCHNTLGRIYLFVIAPFHRMVARSVLRNSQKVGWPQSKET